MSSLDSITAPPSDKISKPRPDFPLGPHPAGYWCKRVKGQLHYFGPHWKTKDQAGADAAAEAALEDYNKQEADLKAGRKPPPDPEGVTVKDVVNAFLNHRKAKLDAGELSVHTWNKYNDVTDLLIQQLGTFRLVADLRADDFTALKTLMQRRWGPLRVGDFIQHIRSVFKHAFDAELIDRPVRFGPGFDRPKQKTLRLHKAKQGKKLFTADEIRQMLRCPPWNPDAIAGVQLRAMILLGINCGFGNADSGNLTLSAVDLDNGIIDFPRPKTGVARRCPLWPETIQAIRDAINKRPTPKQDEHAKLVFVTKYGGPWASDTDPGVVTKEMKKLLNALGINGRNRLGFYTLRHTFRTIADEAKDQPATDYIMGHEVAHMSSVYRETISDERLKAVTDHVRAWFFGAGK